MPPSPYQVVPGKPAKGQEGDFHVTTIFKI